MSQSATQSHAISIEARKGGEVDFVEVVGKLEAEDYDYSEPGADHNALVGRWSW